MQMRRECGDYDTIGAPHCSRSCVPKTCCTVMKSAIIISSVILPLPSFCYVSVRSSLKTLKLA